MVWPETLIPGLRWWKSPMFSPESTPRAPGWPGGHHIQPCRDGEGLTLLWGAPQSQGPRNQLHKLFLCLTCSRPHGPASTLNDLGARP